ncbi:NADH-quinone oxidoreductase subunit NuoG [Dichotomicrobium thermohalophilum]|uniref:NADH-quinone oxidoreductase n=1 Tax=Dichotomicrobium thermohalophilum TaxID=933063 RepID=A0A397Q586_9HYPH|nr:NADH-quinone oxidoreductase subunit NuoG [Dichotomicrobium thermohalophilum]RIA56113.1 NADH dehydrogenase subunit G [Dichotomicrobium thermohalophilum]
MPKLIINDREIEVEDGINLLQACEEAGEEIPRFCYHERLSIAGNCRMCLVEVVGMPKPIASCHMSVNDLRPGRDGSPPQVRTDSPLVKKAREGVMEFLLINHPLDCPICDQGGECDLQDQAMFYGVDGSRFHENKRAVEDKNIGPLIKTIMTRCIHCTRCVRFMTEVAGVPELGAIGRGEDMEITTYLEHGMTSELSGNVIDLCPVGALTSKPYAFTARPWELTKTESIDVMDALGANIRVDSRGREVMRFLPREHADVNEEWISDKTRFVWDGLRRQRLDRPYVRKDGTLREVSWGEAFNAIAARLRNTASKRVGAIIGDLAPVEDAYALKSLINGLGSPYVECRQDGAALNPALGRASYIFNTGIAGIDEADAILLVGTNPRLESAVLNARILKAYRSGRARIGVIGEQANLTYEYSYLGAGPDTLREIAEGRHEFADVLKNAERPMLIVGQGALARPDGEGVLRLAAQTAVNTGMLKPDEGWNGFNVLHTAASRVGALDIGCVPSEEGANLETMLAAAQTREMDVLYLLGADEFDVSQTGDAFVIYQGSHGDSGARLADVILPGSAYTEKDGTYVNTEGRVQIAPRAVFPPGEAKEDWAIIRALSEHLGRALPFDTLDQLRSAMYRDHPHLAGIDEFVPGDTAEIDALAQGAAEVTSAPFASPIENYYLTNPIARASHVMQEQAALHQANALGETGTNG